MKELIRAEKTENELASVMLFPQQMIAHVIEVGCVARTELFLRTLRKTLEIMTRIAFKIGATLKGKNLLPEGANSFL